MLHSILLF